MGSSHPWVSTLTFINSLDMIANGINTLIPYYWICVQGSVQALDPTIYNPSSNSNITFIMHMNFYRGLGHIINMSMYMLCKGTMYNTILMIIAHNPNQGHSLKKSCQTLCLMILIFYKKIFMQVQWYYLMLFNKSHCLVIGICCVSHNITNFGNFFS
jgi:hypothetical protein